MGLVVTGGQHEDRCAGRRPVPPEAPHELEPVTVRQTPIDDDRVRLTHDCLLEALGDPGRLDDHDVGQLERDQQPDEHVVIDDQDLRHLTSTQMVTPSIRESVATPSQHFVIGPGRSCVSRHY